MQSTRLIELACLFAVVAPEVDALHSSERLLQPKEKDTSLNHCAWSSAECVFGTLTQKLFILKPLNT
jgi:hypothetical protein